jgi:hypothetical protein
MRSRGLVARLHRAGRSSCEAVGPTRWNEEGSVASVRIMDGDLLRPAVKIAADQGYAGSFLSRGGAARGLREPSDRAGPFS